MRTASDLSVDPVGSRRNGEKNRRKDVVAGQKQNDEARNHAQANRRNEIWNGEYGVEHLVFLGCQVVLRGLVYHLRHISQAPSK